MNPLRRLTRWWRAHRPVIVDRASHQRTTSRIEELEERNHKIASRLFDYEQRHFEDQQRIQQLTSEKENLQAQFATNRSLLANHERDKRRADVAYDEAVDEINRLAAEVRRLRRHERLLDRGILAQLLERHISEN